MFTHVLSVCLGVAHLYTWHAHMLCALMHDVCKYGNVHAHAYCAAGVIHVYTHVCLRTCYVRSHTIHVSTGHVHMYMLSVCVGVMHVCTVTCTQVHTYIKCPDRCPHHGHFFAHFEKILPVTVSTHPGVDAPGSLGATSPPCKAGLLPQLLHQPFLTVTEGSGTCVSSRARGGIGSRRGAPSSSGGEGQCCT